MLFEARAFKLAKDTERPADYEDAYRMDASRGIAAIADGVTAGIFSGRWAAMLTTAVVADPPEVDRPEAFAAWLAGLRAGWSEQIDPTGLAWFQKAKLKQGAFSTLLWVRIEPAPDPAGPHDHRLRGCAMGDSCLFHVRDGQTLRSFPIERSEQMEADPLVLGSVDLNRDRMLRFAALDVPCRSGDLVVLCTDALAAWALRRQECNDPLQWDGYWQMTEPEWQAEIVELRAQQKMRYDDTTLLLLRVNPQPSPAAAEAAPAAAEAAPAPVVAAPDESAAENVFLDFVKKHSPPPEDAGGDSSIWRWAESIASASEDLAGQVTDEVVRGMKQFKQRMLDKYRKTPPQKPEK